MGELMKYTPSQFTKHEMRVEFSFQEGIDAGGPRREWFSLVLREVFSPEKGLFKLSSNGITYQPDPSSILIPDFKNHYRYAGRILAKAIID